MQFQASPVSFHMEDNFPRCYIRNVSVRVCTYITTEPRIIVDYRSRVACVKNNTGKGHIHNIAYACTVIVKNIRKKKKKSYPFFTPRDIDYCNFIRYFNSQGLKMLMYLYNFL